MTWEIASCCWQKSLCSLRRPGKEDDSIIEQEDGLFIVRFLHHAAIVGMMKLLQTDIVKIDSKEGIKLQKKMEKKYNHKLDVVLAKICTYWWLLTFIYF